MRCILTLIWRRLQLSNQHVSSTKYNSFSIKTNRTFRPSLYISIFVHYCIVCIGGRGLDSHNCKISVWWAWRFSDVWVFFQYIVFMYTYTQYIRHKLSRTLGPDCDVCNVVIYLFIYYLMFVYLSKTEGILQRVQDWQLQRQLVHVS